MKTNVPTAATYSAPEGGRCSLLCYRWTPQHQSFLQRFVSGSACGLCPSSLCVLESWTVRAPHSDSTLGFWGQEVRPHIQSRLHQGPWPPHPSVPWPLTETGLSQGTKDRKAVNIQHFFFNSNILKSKYLINVIVLKMIIPFWFGAAWNNNKGSLVMSPYL